jgi:WD40 repeat protein
MRIQLDDVALSCGWTAPDAFWIALESGAILHYSNVDPYQRGEKGRAGVYLGPHEVVHAAKPGEEMVACTYHPAVGSVCSYGDHVIRHPEAGQDLSLQRSTSIRCLAISPDGQFLAFGNAQGDVEIVSCTDFRSITPPYRRIHSSWIYSLLWPQDHLLVSADLTGEIQWRNPWTGAEIEHLGIASGYSPQMASFSTEEVAVATKWGQVLLLRPGQVMWIESVRGAAVIACAPSQEMIAVADEDGMISLYKPYDSNFSPRHIHEHVYGIPPHQKAYEITCLAFSPDGRFLLSCGIERIASLLVLRTDIPRRSR